MKHTKEEYEEIVENLSLEERKKLTQFIKEKKGTVTDFIDKFSDARILIKKIKSLEKIEDAAKRQALLKDIVEEMAQKYAEVFQKGLKLKGEQLNKKIAELEQAEKRHNRLSDEYTKAVLRYNNMVDEFNKRNTELTEKLNALIVEYDEKIDKINRYGRP